MATTFNKPAGLPVFPPHDNPEGDCLLRRLLAEQPWRSAAGWPPGFEGGIAHRLDTATSGAVLAADNLPELIRLRQWFGEHRLVKTYLMLAAVDVPWDSNVCAKPIAHHPRKRDRMVVQRGKQTLHRGKWYPAHSDFARRADRLWEVRIATGVTHQVRVHAAFLGIPILGDVIYGGARGASSVEAAPAAWFHLHHVGVVGPEGFRSQSIADPPWAQVTDRDAP